MKPGIALAVVMAVPSLSMADANARSKWDDAVSARTDSPSEPPVSIRRQNGWLIIDTTNFHIQTRQTAEDSTDLARRCERLRTLLQTTWFGESKPAQWTPRCQVVVHGTLAEYRQALGSQVGRSVGCATTKVDGQRVTYRRVDLRADADNWSVDALPHELTHIVVADDFHGVVPPWVNEGMGVLAESSAKQAERREAWMRAVSRGTVYSSHELLHVCRPPQPTFRDAFYSQSAALVRRLVERKSPMHFVQFVRRCQQCGYRRALRKTYGPDHPALTSTLRPGQWHCSPIWKPLDAKTSRSELRPVSNANARH